MSSDVFSTGLMVPLATPVPEQDREDLMEQLYDDATMLRINYEGTLAYISQDFEDGYGLFFDVGGGLSVEELAVLCVAYGLHPLIDQARPFNCLWYNGADSDLDVITLEEFLQQTGQT